MINFIDNLFNYFWEESQVIFFLHPLQLYFPLTSMNKNSEKLIYYFNWDKNIISRQDFQEV